MSTMTKETKLSQRIIDAYLGFEIVLEAESFYLAVPKSWGDSSASIVAQDLPSLRKKIWRWWHLS